MTVTVRDYFGTTMVVSGKMRRFRFLRDRRKAWQSCPESGRYFDSLFSLHCGARVTNIVEKMRRHFPVLSEDDYGPVHEITFDISRAIDALKGDET